MKQSKFRNGLFFGSSMTIFSIAGHLFTEDNLTSKSVLEIILFALLGGVISGVLFGWISGSSSNSKYYTKGAEFVPDEGETILHETVANHFKGIEAVGGKLYLTNKRLVFKSHKLNIQTHKLSVGLNDIIAVNRYKTLGLVNNGVSITTTKDKTEKFVIQKVELWTIYLTGIINLQTL